MSSGSSRQVLQHGSCGAFRNLSYMIDDAPDALRLGSGPRPGACSPQLVWSSPWGWLGSFRLPGLSFGEAHGQEWLHQRGITVEILEAVCRGFGRAGRPSGIRRETVTCRRLRVLVSFGSGQLCSFFSLSDTVGCKEA
jgi:hypothetical protein